MKNIYKHPQAELVSLLTENILAGSNEKLIAADDIEGATELSAQWLYN